MAVRGAMSVPLTSPDVMFNGGMRDAHLTWILAVPSAFGCPMGCAPLLGGMGLVRLKDSQNSATLFDFALGFDYRFGS